MDNVGTVHVTAGGPTRSSWIVKQNEPRAGERDLVGGKAANLYHLAQIGCAVPSWFCVSVGLADALRTRAGVDAALLDRNLVDFVEAELTDFCRRVQDAITAAPLREDEESLILAAFDATFGSGAVVAVRSSATSEDGSHHSFAGLLETYLSVTRENVVQRIKECIASAWAPQCILYLKKKGLREPIRTAVIVQSLIRARKSGVLFTSNPIGDQSSQMMIVAGFGLGEGVVDARVETDTYVLDAINGHLQSSDVVQKTREVSVHSEGQDGTVLRPLGDGVGRGAVLDSREIARLYDAGIHLASYFRGPQDIEWSYGHDEKLYILQSRPITTAGGSQHVFDASNVSENYQGAVTPLTYSYVRKYYHDVFLAVGKMFGLQGAGQDAIQPALQNMVGYLNGGIYYKLESWYQLFFAVPGFEYFVRAFEHGVGIQGTPTIYKKYEIAFRTKPRGGLYFAKTWARISLNLLSLPARMATVRRRFENFRRETQTMRIETMSASELVQLYDRMQAQLASRWGAALLNDYYAFNFFMWLERLLKKWRLDSNGEVLSELMRSGDNLASMAPVQALRELARELNTLPRLRELIESSDFKAFEAALSTPDHRQFGDRLAGYINEFGDRRFDELKLESPTLGENPTSVYSLLRNLIAAGERQAMELSERPTHAGARARQHLKKATALHPLRRIALYSLQWVISRSIRYREYGRLVRSQRCGLERQVLLALGRRLAVNGALPSPDSVYFLTVEELLDYARGTSVTVSLEELVDIRRREFEDNKAGPHPVRVTTGELPYKDLPSLSDRAHLSEQTKERLEGVGCSAGRVHGVARVVHDPNGGHLQAGEILIAHSTDPAWAFLMAASAGLIVERGNLLSHAAIIGRELGIPCVIGVENAQHLINSGDVLTMDGTEGWIQIHREDVSPTVPVSL
ncbi:PEP/pyruvate-binding domain-containing protein [Achromobacter xylosoxidans]|uniref:PEP/pyruvate-binding domain-containing protein n=1 Tax=Alcaligenes xylosoxydans xylosoxydans TaxID=85698 RepID=UPI000970275C|nr:PEP/pyruvate-binding domain-containing protein [Achromobacter xylosoxidans]BEG75473.1 Prodigiosin synthesizing transferase PigC [Achromobacter xylosoxidans]